MITRLFLKILPKNLSYKYVQVGHYRHDSLFMVSMVNSNFCIGSVCHPWLFIEETANREVEKDFASVYSRLVLCKTFRLDEDGKVLTPEEVIIQMIISHESYLMLDTFFLLPRKPGEKKSCCTGASKLST